MPEPSSRFLTLLTAARAGDQTALEQLVELYEPQLRLVARDRLGPALRPYLDSVDLVQSVHRSLIIGIRLDKFDVSTPQNLLALALTIVRRKVARHWQRMRRQERQGSRGSQSDELAQTLSSLSAPQSDPAQVAEFNDQVRHICAQLDATDRRMVELRFEGYSTAEAARRMGVEPNMLRVRLFRLRDRLRSSGIDTDCL
jgi:RNA polymerase sigma-70 factor (ECF subfamily)